MKGIYNMNRIATLKNGLSRVLGLRLYVGRSLATVPENALVLFPCRQATLHCGLAGIVALKSAAKQKPGVDLDDLENRLEHIAQRKFTCCTEQNLSMEELYLNGGDALGQFFDRVKRLKHSQAFIDLFLDRERLSRIDGLSDKVAALIQEEDQTLSARMGHLETRLVACMSAGLETLKDAQWCLVEEINRNIQKTGALITHPPAARNPEAIKIFREINTVLNSIDRLEVRGRDSAGISLLFVLANDRFAEFQTMLEQDDLVPALKERMSKKVLLNNDISLFPQVPADAAGPVSISFTYKIAAEIGSLGDNIAFIREQIQNDAIFQRLATCSPMHYTISSHTRWASIGEICEANCHPVDNKLDGEAVPLNGIIHTCLNGDIDNYLDLKAGMEKQGLTLPAEISTDTKMIPLQVEQYIRQGHDMPEAFRLAVNQFEGSHAISMHSDLAPGKLFLAQKGSGQAIFVGLSDEIYLPASEVYGFVEETSAFLKMDGEKIVEGVAGETQGQIFILDQTSSGGIDGITAMYYDGTPIELSEADIKHTDITSRDIDRQNFPHYFLKEISESPLSVEKTLYNRWKSIDETSDRLATTLDESVLPTSLATAIAEKSIRRIYFVGQGTAGVAAKACSVILDYYLNDPLLYIHALKASELSGSKLHEGDAPDSMADALIVAISQSGTTTDTNRTVDMVKERGAATLAIVNRRDSDLTFKVDGVMYTSTGRDLEMSVASTKAFYSQIVAGALLSLHIAFLAGKRGVEFVSQELRDLRELPTHMKTILGMQKQIAVSARKLAATKTYWAAVGSGPNKASADEIRIKLSELCYKTISSDFVEDKKHIDLSSEPLIIVCAAGARDTVIGDIIKDAAIFKAHKATPVVIANQGEQRFAPYAEDIFHVPAVSEHLAPIVNTLVGHIWGYYAALAINEGSKFLNSFRTEIRKSIDDSNREGLDVYEVILEKSFRERVALFYKDFRAKRRQKKFPISIAKASDLILLLKYLAGRLPVSDFEIDFAIRGTALNMLNTLFTYLGDSINSMSRPIDAIKHQAKTVTVGTSRISEKVEGLLFDALSLEGLKPSQLTNRNVLVLKNLQQVIARIKGSILYRIGHLNLLGEPTPDTSIEVLVKRGELEPIPSRVETDTALKGTKRIIVSRGNVYIGKGRKDQRSILVIPVITSGGNIIENLLLLNVAFKENVALDIKIKALGGKYDHIKNIVQENSVEWHDRHIENIEIEELFGISAEKIGERIVSQFDQTTTA
jgi:glucosamine--fructose-6-phosphate aminotransferase (isomerizing)